MSDILGKIIGIVLSFLLCVLAPLTLIVLSEDTSARRNIYSEMTRFVDTVTDTGEITEAQLKDFYYGVSSYGPQCSVTITRYIRVVNPGVTADGSSSSNAMVSYIPKALSSTGLTTQQFEQGDLIKVHVEATGYTGMQQFARATIGAALRPISFSVTAKVRKGSYE